MSSNLTAHRLLKAYQALAADGYPGGPRAFSDLADLAHACLTGATTEQRLPAMVLQNIFDGLAQTLDPDVPRPATKPVVAPELHAALLTALKFVVTGGAHARCIQVSERLIRAASHHR